MIKKQRRLHSSLAFSTLFLLFHAIIKLQPKKGQPEVLVLSMNSADFLRYLILAGWGIVIVGAIVLRYNSKSLSATVRRYLAYLGYVDPQDLPGFRAPLVPDNSVKKSNTAAV
jgi:hypothetical protein